MNTVQPLVNTYYRQVLLTSVSRQETTFVLEVMLMWITNNSLSSAFVKFTTAVIILQDPVGRRGCG